MYILRRIEVSTISNKVRLVSSNQFKLEHRAKKGACLVMGKLRKDWDNLSWLFFDMGSTLIDETAAMEHRICEVIAGTEITYEQFVEKKLFFARQNKPADLETIKFFGPQRRHGIRKMKYYIQIR